MEAVLKALCNAAVPTGRIEVELASGRRFVAGRGTGAPEVKVRFTDRAAERAIILYPEMAFGELVTEGRIVVERGNLYDLLVLLIRGQPGGRGLLGSTFVRSLRLAAHRLLGASDRQRARANAAHHYDLDRRFYEMFLDGDLNYSCAYFERPGQSLETAQLAKKRHVAAKLCLEPGQSVLDIGCGWGGLAIYLAETAGAGRVLGITLSEEQAKVATERVAARGLSGRVEVALRDYREVEGSVDRIVSVGMFEHVGRAHYDTFFDVAARLLNDDGVMLLHTIGWPGKPSPVNPWVAKYIFPGGHIPTLIELTPAIQLAGLIVTDVEVLRLHYAETLRHWRQRFLARRDEVAQLYDERFCRMWEFYLASSEAGFRYDNMLVYQVQLAKRIDAVPATRDYIPTRESELRERETGRAVKPRSPQLPADAAIGLA